jgi:class 3 adenylate cyclase/tetratricopeptide (TPR) repeat protein
MAGRRQAEALKNGSGAGAGTTGEAPRADPDAAPLLGRSNVTILFSDLTGSSRILRHYREPEYSEDLLRRIRLLFREIVPKHGGKVAHIAGDGVLAFFGHPEPREDDVLRAIEAAIDLRAACRRIGEEERWRGLPPTLHSAIHSGEVLVIEGDELCGPYVLYGEPTNDTKHLCDAAKRDEILVSDSALGPERNRFEAGYLSMKWLKGRDVPIPAVAILGRAPVNSRYAGSKRAGLTPFVGRQAELQLLARKLDSVGDGGSAFLKIRGAPGEGKTRLAEEFLCHATERHFLVYRGECDAAAPPLQPFLQILRAAFGIDAGMATDEAVAHVVRQLTELDCALFDHRRALLRALSLGDADAKPAEIVEALRAVAARLAAKRPLVLFIDDWHVADDASRAVGAALQGIGALLVLVTARPDAAPGVEMDEAEILELRPLGPDETREAAKALLQSCAPFTLDAIRDATGGTPLFIEEMCHSIGAGHLAARASDRMAWLRTLIRARFSRLAPDEAEQVRMAAVIGNAIPGWLFRKVCGASASALDRLVAEDFIFPGERKDMLRFKHGLTREVVYESIGPDERRKAHLEVAKAYRARRSPAGEEAPVEALAYHFGEAGEHEKAAGYAELAGKRALDAHALDRAQLHYRAAMAALEQLPRAPETMTWLDRLARAYFRAGVFDPSSEQVAVFERAIDRARIRADRNALARSQYWLGYIHYALGEPLAAIASCERALANALAVGDDSLAAQIGATLGQAKAAAADYDEALTLLDAAILRQRLQPPPRGLPIGLAYSLSCKGFALGDLGRFDEAATCFEEALAAIGGGMHELGVSILNQYAVVRLWQGRCDEARGLAEGGMAVAEHVRSHYSHAMSRSIRAFACWSADSDPAHIRTIEEATRWLAARGRGQFTSLNHGWLAEMNVREGRLRDACGHAARALRRARKRDRLGEAMALRAMARAAALERWPREPGRLSRPRRGGRLQLGTHPMSIGW